MGSLRNGVTLAKRSVGVLRDEPKLLVLPAASAIVVLLALVAVGTVGLLGGLLTDERLLAERSDFVMLAGLFVVYFVASFVATYFNAALVYCARQALTGEPVSVRAGLRAAWGVKGRILLWAVVAATVGVALRLVEERFERVGWALSALFDVAWSLLTFFIVPVIVFERERGGAGMFARSGRLFRDTWGETVVADLGVLLVTVLAAAAGIGVAVLALLFGPGVLFLPVVVALVSYLVVVALAGTALSNIVRTALYLYARDGTLPDAFGDLDAGALFADGTAGGTAREGTARDVA